MQSVSQQYKKSMDSPLRNRSYIRVSLGIVNQKAQDNARLNDKRNAFSYYSDEKSIFNGGNYGNIYATAEKDFSKVDGTTYFLPQNKAQIKTGNGIVTDEFMGAIYVDFGGQTGFDIKGLTIDFGEMYPVNFEIETNNGIVTIENNNTRYFSTEEAFYNTSFFVIRPLKMLNEESRLRIHSFQCGIANVFTNKETKSFYEKEFVSPIAETIPSKDISVTVDNQSLYYSPDNPDSAIAFFDVGQELRYAFGYDVDGNGNIEWLPEKVTYLKEWSATDVDATFISTDRMMYLTNEYYKGHFSKPNTVSLYDLAVEVFEDAGETNYYIDSYLKDVYVENPLPRVTHGEALQIIANAGRCSLSEDRQGRICLKSQFIPDMAISSNGETEYSNLANVLEKNGKIAYAVSSKDFSTVDGTLLFMPSDGNYGNVGYASEQIADENGLFEENPTITVDMESTFVAFGLYINFKNTAPQEFKVNTFLDDVAVEERIVTNPNLEYADYKQFEPFNKMVVTFTKGYPHSRVFISNMNVGEITDYRLSRNSLTESPKAERMKKIRSIQITRDLYSLREIAEGEELEQLSSIELTANGETNFVEELVLFNEPCYKGDNGYTIEVESDYTAFVNESKADESGVYYAKVRIASTDGSLIPENTVFKIFIKGQKYTVNEVKYIKNHNVNGENKTWHNPLISSTEQAKEVEEWLSSHLLGNVEYDIAWRGDPRTDANDMFYLELKDREDVAIRAYENELQFNGSLKGFISARKVVL